jgi:hypothetical protein
MAASLFRGGMSYKIFTGAKPFLKAGLKPFGITEIEMPTLGDQGLTPIKEMCYAAFVFDN